MDLSHPGTDLLRASEAAALLTLARMPAGASGREIARLSGKESHASVLRGLGRLSEMGLVHNRAVGSATIYTLNRDHVYWPAIFEILASPAKVEERIGAIVESYGNKGVTAAVFGSFVRQEAPDSSDLDLVIVVPDDFLPADRDGLANRLTDELSTLTGNRVQVVNLSTSAVRRMSGDLDPLVDSWRMESRTVVGPELRLLISDAFD